MFYKNEYPILHVCEKVKRKTPECLKKTCTKMKLNNFCLTLVTITVVRLPQNVKLNTNIEECTVLLGMQR